MLLPISSPQLPIPPQLAIVRPAQEAPKPIEPSLEEKIASNYYKCDTLTQWIWAQDATCHDKLLIEQQNTSTAPIYGSGSGSIGNTYYAGQCVWYIKNIVPWVQNGWGNANQWVYLSGHKVSPAPIVGAVASGISYSHVALVTGISGNTVTVTEMNYNGPFKEDVRTAPISEFQYIYP